jgi:hypothetical protein
MSDDKHVITRRDFVRGTVGATIGESKLDLVPAGDSESSIRVLAEVLRRISFEGGTTQSDAVGEVAFRKMIRLIIQDAHHRNPQPLPVIVFLHGDHTGQLIGELNELVNDFLERRELCSGSRTRAIIEYCH